MSVYMLDCNRGHLATEHVRTCFRPADVRDTSSLVAALREEGVGEVERRHAGEHVPSKRHYDLCSRDCRFVDVLVVRIDGEET